MLSPNPRPTPLDVVLEDTVFLLVKLVDLVNTPEEAGLAIKQTFPGFTWGDSTVPWYHRERELLITYARSIVPDWDLMLKALCRANNARLMTDQRLLQTARAARARAGLDATTPTMLCGDPGALERLQEQLSLDITAIKDPAVQRTLVAFAIGFLAQYYPPLGEWGSLTQVLRDAADLLERGEELLW